MENLILGLEIGQSAVFSLSFVRVHSVVRITVSVLEKSFEPISLHGQNVLSAQTAVKKTRMGCV